MESARKEGSRRIALIGKGGKEQIFALSLDLRRTLSLWFAHRPHSPPRKGYRSDYARAITAARGRVTGTHGAAAVPSGTSTPRSTARPLSA